MTLQFLSLFPLLFALAASLGIALLCLSRRNVPGRNPLIAVALNQAVWMVLYILEVVSRDVAEKVFWDTCQWVPTFAFGILMIVFAYEFTGQTPRHFRLRLALLSAPLAFYMLLALTYNLHDLTHSNIHLEPAPPFSSLVYDFGPATWLITLYGYGLFFFAVYLLGRQWGRVSGIYRTQITIFLIGAFFGVLIGTGPIFLGIRVFGQRDSSPFGTLILSVALAWGLLRYRMFDLVPIARHLVIDQMRDMFVVVDTQGRVVDLNPRALPGVNRDSVIGRPTAEVFSQWGGLVERFRDVSDLHTTYEADVNGVKHYYEMEITSIRNPAGQMLGRLLLSHDVTELEQAKQEALELKLEQERAKMLATFIQGAAHEFRTPLTVIATSAYLIGKTEDQDLQKFRAKGIQQQVENLAKLVDAMLNYVNAEYTPVVLKPDVKVNNVLRAIYAELTRAMWEKEQTCMLDLQEDLPAIRADSTQLTYALKQILENAVKYTPPKGNITIQSRLEETDIAITITDDGIGMNPAILPRIFETGYREDAVHTQPGFGLGLPIAKKVIETHGGRIDVTSEKGKGTVVRIRLPIQPGDALTGKGAAL